MRNLFQKRAMRLRRRVRTMLRAMQVTMGIEHRADLLHPSSMP
jgi:hypothetical protein